MAKTSLKLWTESSGFDDQTGHWSGRRVFLVHRDTFESTLRSSLEPSLSNKWPSKTGIYDACITHMSVRPAIPLLPYVMVTCLYEKPTAAMILQPGRGLINFSSYSTVKVKDAAVFNSTIAHNDGETVYSYQNRLRRRRATDELERALIVVRTADSVTNYETVLARAVAWIGKGGTLNSKTNGTFDYGNTSFSNLKLARVDLTPRADDVSVIDGVWQFAQNPDGWRSEGVINDEWYAADALTGVEVEYDPDANPPVIPGSAFMALKLKNEDYEVITGEQDFTDIEGYFDWTSPAE